MPRNSNTVQTNFNVAPYYDDFDENKNFHRILFKPSLAVQARELTQMQTILQNQIDRFGEHIFSEGSLVSGGTNNFNNSYHFIKIRDNDILSNPVNLADFANSRIRGVTSGIIAEVIGFEDGSEDLLPDAKTFYINYINSGTDTETRTFMQGEQIISDEVTMTILDLEDAVGEGSLFSIEGGIVFAKDHFVLFDSQSIIIDKYAPNPSVKIGFNIEESIVNSIADSTLLDPADGSFNFTAPGADRFVLRASLSIVGIDEEVSAPDFVELIDIRDGVTQSQVVRTDYSIIRDELARRTFDESGNYVVNGFNVSTREHLNDGTNNGRFFANDGGNSSLLSVSVEPGLGYVYGYDVENLVTSYVDIEKGIDFVNVEQQNISANYGNYIEVNEVCGRWDINQGGILEIYDTPQEKLTRLENSSTIPTGNVIGTTRIKAIEYIKGTIGLPNALYRIYVYDTRMSSSSFTEAKSLRFANSDADGFADIILSNDGIANIRESSFNTAIFNIPTTAIRSIRDDNDEIDTTFQFVKKFDVSVSIDGSFSINTGFSDEVFPYSTGVLNSTQKNDFIVTLNEDINVPLVGTINVTSGNRTIFGSGTNFNTSLNVGDKIQIAGSNEILRVSEVNSNTAIRVETNPLSSASGSAVSKIYLEGEIINFSGRGANGTIRNISLNNTTSASFNFNETLSASTDVSVICKLSKIDAREVEKNIVRNTQVVLDIDSHPQSNNGPWTLGVSDVIRIKSIRKHTTDFSTPDYETLGTDVTNEYTLDNGQRDTFYANARIIKKSSANLNENEYLSVIFDHFVPDNSQGSGYFSVDSYPVDDNNATIDSENVIRTIDIPTYISPVTGISHDLRDSIDTRPIKTNTANITTFDGRTINPVESSNFLLRSGTLHTPAPNENFIADYSYYLRRHDVIHISESGIVGRTRGTPSLRPITPTGLSDTMELAVIEVAPFPSLPFTVARDLNIPEYSNRIRNMSNKRFTMRDIGVIQNRVKNLEYYTSLTFLEKDTLDTKILDSNGLDRFKNGILVDPFKTHAIGNLQDPSYRIAIDQVRAEIRPTFNLKNIDTIPYQNSGTVKNGQLITLPYENELFIQQNLATTTRNAAGAFYRYIGEMILDPSQDTWMDTVQRPDIRIDIGGSEQDLANWELQAEAWGTQWDSWETNSTRAVGPPRIVNTDINVSGFRTTTTTTTAQNFVTNQTRTGSAVEFAGVVEEETRTDSIVASNLVPFMRSRVIRCSAVGLKENTRLYTFFDDEDVYNYITPTDSNFVPQSEEATDLSTDNNGEVYFLFRIPNNNELRFTIGTKKLRISDSITNSLQFGNVTVVAEAAYTAHGLENHRQGTIVSTATPIFETVLINESRNNISTRNSSSTTIEVEIPPPPPPPVIPTRPTPIPRPAPRPRPRGRDQEDMRFPPNIGRGARAAFLGIGGGGGGDPIAQSFMVRKTSLNSTTSGYFLSKIDLFFNTKHATQGVTIDVREMRDGIVSRNVVPYSKTIVNSSDINISDDSTVSTPITFETPLFLLTDVEYAFIVKPIGNNSETNVWTARLGETDIITNTRVNKQPASGSLFISSNDLTYEPVQDEDLKYSLYIANFTSNSGSVLIGNKPTEFMNIENFTGNFLNAEEVTGSTSGAKGVIVYRNTVDEEVEIHVEKTNENDFIESETIIGTTSQAGADISRIIDLEINVFNPKVSNLSPSLTNISWGSKLVELNNNLQNNFNEVVINSNNTPRETMKILSRSNENDLLGGDRSYQLNATLTTEDRYISPVIDIGRSNTSLVENIVNNDSTDEDTASSGNALARYISKRVTLAEGQDAEDLSIYLSCYRPVNTNIEVYFKAIHNEDSDIFEDVVWRKMDSDSAGILSDSENDRDFREFLFNIPLDNLTGANEEYEYVNSNGVTFTGFKYFAVKIVLLSTNKAYIPRCKDLRVIALQK